MTIKYHLDREGIRKALQSVPKNVPVVFQGDPDGARFRWQYDANGGAIIQRIRSLSWQASATRGNQGGEVCLPTEAIYEICRKATQNDHLYLETDDDLPDQVFIEAPPSQKLPIRGRFLLRQPKMPANWIVTGSTLAGFTFEARHLVEGIKRATPCIDPNADQPFANCKDTETGKPNHSGYYLAGILISCQGCLGVIAGTDGGQLCQSSYATVSTQEADGESRSIIPQAAIKPVLEFLESLEANEPVSVQFSEKHLTFRAGDDSIVIRVPDAAFNESEKNGSKSYRLAFPKLENYDLWPDSLDTRATVRVKTDRFAKAVKAIKGQKDKDEKSVDLTIYARSGIVELAVSGRDSSSETMQRINATAIGYADPDKLSFLAPFANLENIVKIAGKADDFDLIYYGPGRPMRANLDGTTRFLMMPMDFANEQARKDHEERRNNRDSVKAASVATETASVATAEPATVKPTPEPTPAPVVRIAKGTDRIRRKPGEKAAIAAQHADSFDWNAYAEKYRAGMKLVAIYRETGLEPFVVDINLERVGVIWPKRVAK